MPSSSPRNEGKPTVAERLERARAAAAPKFERAASEAAPKVEKAAQAAGSFLGTLAGRARETMKQFSEGINGEDDQPGTPPAQAAPPQSRPRPRPRPGPRPDETR